MKRSVFPSFRGFDRFPAVPETGWVKAARRALGLSLRQVGKLLGVSAQAVRDAEQRELDGSISLQRLREVAAAIDMELVYGFVPKGGSVEALEMERAYAVASKIHERTMQTMVLEAQVPYGIDQQQRVHDLAERIIREKPELLWH